MGQLHEYSTRGEVVCTVMCCYKACNNVSSHAFLGLSLKANYARTTTYVVPGCFWSRALASHTICYPDSAYNKCHLLFDPFQLCESLTNLLWNQRGELNVLCPNRWLFDFTQLYWAKQHLCVADAWCACLLACAQNISGQSCCYTCIHMYTHAQSTCHLMGAFCMCYICFLIPS